MAEVIRTWTNWTTAIPITVGTTGYKFYTEFGMAMPARSPGQIIIATGSAEVTNPYSFICQLDSYIGYGLPDVNQDETKPLTPNSGTNISPGIHHQTVHITGIIDDALLRRWGIPLSLPANWVLTLTMEAATTDPAGAGAYLINEPGCGELAAVIL